MAMNIRKRNDFVMARLIPLLLLAVSSPAFASLGGDAASVQADAAHMKGSVRVTQAAAYAVHEIQHSSGAVVREYVSPEGKVFAVSWQGAGQPDMRQMLGTYFEQFQRSAQMKRARRAPLMLNESGLVVEMSGHPRHFVGRAYLLDMVPQNVAPQQIR